MAKTHDHVTIAHDAFARFETVRRTCAPRQACAWCGQPARWNYGYQMDGISTRPEWDHHAYCSIGCFRTYREGR